jgi:hypothetical protein
MRGHAGRAPLLELGLALLLVARAHAAAWSVANALSDGMVLQVPSAQHALLPRPGVSACVLSASRSAGGAGLCGALGPRCLDAGAGERSRRRPRGSYCQVLGGEHRCVCAAGVEGRAATAGGRRYAVRDILASALGPGVTARFARVVCAGRDSCARMFVLALRPSDSADLL